MGRAARIIFDLGHGTIKLLHTSEKQAQTAKTVEGMCIPFEDAFRSILRREETAQQAVKDAMAQCALHNGQPYTAVTVVYAHPSLRSLTLPMKVRLAQERVITEEWLHELKMTRLQRVLARYPNEVCVQAFTISVVADGQTITEHAAGTIVRQQLVITHVFILEQRKVQESLLDLFEPITEEVALLPASLAGGSLLSMMEKDIGTALLDIGAETTGISVWKRGVPIQLHTLPIGGSLITKAIALEKQISITDATRLKHRYHTESDTFTQKELRKIGTAMREYARAITSELKKIDPHLIFPGGIVLLGGGSLFPELVQCIQKETKLYTKAYDRVPVVSETRMPSCIWATAYGALCYVPSPEETMGSRPSLWKRIGGSLRSLLRFFGREFA